MGTQIPCIKDPLWSDGSTFDRCGVNPHLMNEKPNRMIGVFVKNYGRKRGECILSLDSRERISQPT